STSAIRAATMPRLRMAASASAMAWATRSTRTGSMGSLSSTSSSAATSTCSRFGLSTEASLSTGIRWFARRRAARTHHTKRKDVMKKTGEDTHLVQAANKIVERGYRWVERQKKRDGQRLLAARDWLKILIKSATDEPARAMLPCPVVLLEG